jgi:hypothetical protein
MTADWDVNDALEETIDAIRLGALGLNLGQTLHDHLKAHYYDDFKKQHDDGVEWYGPHGASLKIIPLAGTVGVIAAALTTAKPPASSSAVPTDLDETSTFQAAHVVATIFCPNGLHPEGGFCVKARNDLRFGDAGQAFEVLIARLRIRGDSSKTAC